MPLSWKAVWLVHAIASSVYMSAPATAAPMDPPATATATVVGFWWWPSTQGGFYAGTRSGSICTITNEEKKNHPEWKSIMDERTECSTEDAGGDIPCFISITVPSFGFCGKEYMKYATGFRDAVVTEYWRDERPPDLKESMQKYLNIIKSTAPVTSGSTSGGSSGRSKRPRPSDDPTSVDPPVNPPKKQKGAVSGGQLQPSQESSSSAKVVSEPQALTNWKGLALNNAEQLKKLEKDKELKAENRGDDSLGKQSTTK